MGLSATFEIDNIWREKKNKNENISWGNLNVDNVVNANTKRSTVGWTQKVEQMKDKQTDGQTDKKDRKGIERLRVSIHFMSEEKY